MRIAFIILALLLSSTAVAQDYEIESYPYRPQQRCHYEYELWQDYYFRYVEINGCLYREKVITRKYFVRKKVCKPCVGHRILDE